MIPRIFHHIWLGPDPLPESAEAWRKTWVANHPDWKLLQWGEDDLAWLKNRRLFERATSYAQKADVARYEIVHRFGGVYLDTDMESLRPIDELLAELTFFAGREQSGFVSNSIFGAEPGHPILGDVIFRLPASCALNRNLGINMQTGPGLLTRVIEDGNWESQKVRIFPPAYFYPYDWTEPWRAGERFRNAFAAHHWHFGWKGQQGVRVTHDELSMFKLVPFLREADHRARSWMRSTVLGPGKKFVKKSVARLLPPDDTPHAIPWGSGEVLVATPFGTQLLCPTDDISLAPELALRGTYDKEFIGFMGRALRAGMTFVDVGANIGLFTIVAGSLVGRGGRVFAYECNPELLPLLHRNVRLNWFEDRVNVIPKAAHRDHEKRELAVPLEQKGLGSLSRFNTSEVESQDLQRFEVECERLDSGVARLPYIDLLKIDVEGGEAAVLDGASGLLDDQRVGAISLEYRQDVLPEEMQGEMAEKLASLVTNFDARFYVPGDQHPIPLAEVLTLAHYPQLLVKLPHSSIAAV